MAGTSERSTEALGVGEVMVRVLRREFMAGGNDALAASLTSDSSRLKVGGPLLSQRLDTGAPCRGNQHQGRLSSARQLSKVLRKKEGPLPAAAAHPEGPKARVRSIDRVSRLRKVGEICFQP